MPTIHEGRFSRCDLRKMGLAVGNPAKFDRPLSTLGEVREVDITIREPRK